MDMLRELLPQILVAILIPVAGIIGTLIARLIKGLIKKNLNENLQGLAYVGVRWAQQKFKDLHGQDKFDKVYTAIASKIKGVDKMDIEEAIEAAVEGMNKELGPTASGSTKPPESPAG